MKFLFNCLRFGNKENYLTAWQLFALCENFLYIPAKSIIVLENMEFWTKYFSQLAEECIYNGYTPSKLAKHDLQFKFVCWFDTLIISRT